MSPRHHRRQTGLTLTEVLVAIAVGGLLLAGLGGIAAQAQRAEAEARERNDLTRDARLAMQRMVAAVAASERLLVPRPELAGTVWSEAVREPGVLALTLDPLIDRNRDGFADADNDHDGLVDEDLPRDATNDDASGVVGVDDDGDGVVDEDNNDDDDEDGVQDEDVIDGADNDGDGLVDEDAGGDMNGDGESGEIGVDDDGDGEIDEDHGDDDDEDGRRDEDWLDVVVYRLDGTSLIERMPAIDALDGNDFKERIVASNVSRFRVERVPPAAPGLAVLVDIALELTGASGRVVKLGTRVRVGSAR